MMPTLINLLQGRPFILRRIIGMWEMLIIECRTKAHGLVSAKSRHMNLVFSMLCRRRLVNFLIQPPTDGDSSGDSSVAQ